jgi:hypothetical protein
MKPVLMRAVACECLLLLVTLFGARAQQPSRDPTTLQIEDLMNADVTSASKKEQKISRVPAAVFVITQEDIRRFGALNIPDLLRMVPGLEVAQINPSTWATGARGFNGQYSNDAASLDMTGGPEAQGTSPNQQAQLRWYVNPPWHLQRTTSAYFVGRLVYKKIPSNTGLDTNLAWHPSDKISLGLVGQNMVRGLHQDYNDSDLTEIPNLIRRSAYARFTWRF